jgi:hypothetical protein
MSIKTYILKTKKAIDSFRTNDPEASVLYEDLQAQSKEISETFAQIKLMSEQPEIFSVLNENMEELNNLNKLTKAEYDELMSKNFSEFKDKYPTLFEKFVHNDINPEILNNVLDTYTMVEQGKISQRQGRNMGMDYTTDRFNMPKDFFNKGTNFLG